MSRARKGRRQLEALAADLSERDLAIIDSVGQLRLATARQIERLHFLVPSQHATALTAARTARRTLERLVRDGLLVRLERRVGGVRAGSASFIYGLGPVGERLLALGGPQRRFREPSAMFVAHTLAASELYVRLHEATQAGELQLLDTVETEPTCWRRVDGINGASLLKPDLFVITGDHEFEYRWFVEVDLGTEHAPAIIRKCRAYQAYYRSGVEQASAGVFPRVLWVTQNEGREERIREVIGRASDLNQGLFVVTNWPRTTAVLGGGAMDEEPGRQEQVIERRYSDGTN